MGGEIQFGTKADLLKCLEVEKFQMTYVDKVFLPYVRISTAINSPESGHRLG